MRSAHLFFACVIAAAATTALAQVAPSRPRPGGSNRIPAAKSATPATKSSKTVKPDPDLLDGSIYEPEKKPRYGMISEVEIAGSEQKSEQVGGPTVTASAEAATPPPDGQPPGGGGPPPAAEQAPQPPGGPTGTEPDPQQTGVPTSQSAADPNAPQTQAGGIQAEKIDNPQGVASAGPDAAKPASNMKIGDASLQIPSNQQPQQPPPVGAESTSTQQFDKKMPQGQQTDNRNRGSEKGRVMPKGI